MNTSQALISAAAAIAIVGAVGFAVAQTTTDKPMSTTADPMQSQTTTTPNSTMPASPGASGDSTAAPKTNAATGTPGAMSNDASGLPKSGTSAATTNSSDSSGTMPTERAARADRN